LLTSGIRRADRGEQPALVRRLVGGAGEGVVALDHLEERLFLAEQVLLRTAHDCQAHLAERACCLQLGQGIGEPRDLPLEGCLESDVHRARSDGAGPDQEPLQHGVRIVADQPAILEGARLALGGIADHRADGAGVRRDAPPFGARRKSRASTAAQARLGNGGEDGGGKRGASERHGVGAGGGAVFRQRGIGP
jgi:hypothetical protein